MFGVNGNFPKMITLREESNGKCVVPEASLSQRQDFSCGLIFPLPLNKDKGKIIESILAAYKHDRDLLQLPISDDNRIKLAKALFEAECRAVEDILKNVTMTTWRAGTKSVVLEIREGHVSEDIVLKTALKGGRYDDRLIDGYKVALNYLGELYAVPSIFARLNLNVRDIHGFPHRVYFENVIIQRRAIVIGDIMETINRELDKRKGDLRLLRMRPEQIKMDQKVRELMDFRTTIIRAYNEFKEKLLREKNTIDRDGGVDQMERNYGIEIPVNYTPQDHSLKDFKTIKAMRRIKVVGFDFDSFVLKDPGRKIIKQRVPSVFEDQVEKARKALLEKVFVQK